jgi:hypothetical protein
MASLEQLLASLQLDKYIDAFRKNDVNLESAKLFSEKEFEELGLAIKFHTAVKLPGISLVLTGESRDSLLLAFPS